MKIEYTWTVILVALGGTAGMRTLGDSFENAIAADTTAGSHASRTPVATAETPAPAASAVVVGQQAALLDITAMVGHSASALDEGSAFRRLAPQLQREAADAAAAAAHFAGQKPVQLRGPATVSLYDAHGVPWQRGSTYAGFETHDLAVLRDAGKASGIDARARMRTAAEAGDMDWLATELLAERAIMERTALRSETSATELLRLAGERSWKWAPHTLGAALAAEGSMTRALLARHPGVPRAVAAHFVEWSGGWLKDGPVPSQYAKAITERALTFMQRLDARGYAEATIRNVDAVDHGFAIALNDVPAALRAWHSVTDPALSSRRIRALMDSNLKFLERMGNRAEAHLADMTTRWGNVPSLNVVALRAKADKWRSSIQAAKDAVSLSKRDVYQLFDDTLEIVAYADGAPKATSFYDEGRLLGFVPNLSDHQRYFPVASDTTRHWAYGRVVDWQDVQTLPVEVPSFPKLFDDHVSSAGHLTDHDMLHAQLVRRRQASGALDRWLKAGAKIRRMEAARGRTPLTDELRGFVGESLWEGDLPLSELDEAGRNASPIARMVLGQWMAEYGRNTGNAELQQEGLRALRH